MFYGRFRFVSEKALLLLFYYYGKGGARRVGGEACSNSSKVNKLTG